MSNRLKIRALVLGVLLLVLVQSQKEIFIDTTTDGQEVAIFNLFNGMEDGYYVDIGAYDPFYQSNTFNLYSRGWAGINVDANYSRIQKFIHQRYQDTNLHLAVSSSQKIATFYESSEDYLSTINEKVKISAPSSFIGTSQVHSLSLGEICKRYFLMKPNFMNMAIEGLSYEAFASNDWANPNCSPEVISITLDQLNAVSNKPQQILEKNNYKKAVDLPNFSAKSGKELYIHQNYFESYSAQAKINGENFYKDKEIHNLYVILHDLEDFLKIKIISDELSGPHTHTTNSYSQQRYSTSNSGAYIHLSKSDEQLDIAKIHRHSNMVSTKKNRPIVVVNFNPQKSVIIFPTNNVATFEIKTEYYTFLTFNFTTKTNENVAIYILQHFYQPLIRPRFIVTAPKIKKEAPKLKNLPKIDKQYIQKLNFTKVNQMPPISPATSKVLDLTKHTVYPRKQDLDYDYSNQILPITAVFAGSERFDLLEITLSTFFKFNNYPIREIYAINDGFTSPDFQAIKNRYPNITWILTNRRVGQINAIDIVYSYIKTQYFFHSEDDWEYKMGNFIEDSIGILLDNPKVILVFLRDFWGNTPTIIEAERDIFTGMTFNPGLRRMSEYRILPSYSEYCKFRSWGTGAGNDEWCLASFYARKGYRSYTLGKAYVEHLGAKRGSSRFNFIGQKKCE